MRRIEIITPQHVPIQYQLATVRERGLAFFLDFVILACCTLFLYLIIAFATSTGETTQTFAYLIIVPFYTFYSIFFESLMNGQTPGKLAVKIHVIKLTGTDLSFSDYMLRWMFRWLDIWISFGSIAALLVSSSRKGQRLGDVLADTLWCGLPRIITFRLQTCFQSKVPTATNCFIRKHAFLKKRKCCL